MLQTGLHLQDHIFFKDCNDSFICILHIGNTITSKKYFLGKFTISHINGYCTYNETLIKLSNNKRNARALLLFDIRIHQRPIEWTAHGHKQGEVGVEARVISKK